MIAARDVTVVRGGLPRVRGVDLVAHDGEVVVLAGPNGAGKSTLLDAVAGTTPLSDGEVRLDGHPLHDLPPWRRASRLVVLPQSPEAGLGLTAADVVAIGLHVVFGVRDDDAVRRALASVDVLHRADVPVSRLSGGERQRVHLARVLAHVSRATDPCSVLLDEPLAAQDLGQGALVVERCRGLARAGHAVVVVLHDLTAAAALADRVVLLSDGRVCAEGPPTRVLSPVILSDAYRASVDVVPHPVTGGLLVAPRFTAGGSP